MPIDLNPSASETAGFAAMAAGEAIAETTTETPVETTTTETVKEAPVETAKETTAETKAETQTPAETKTEQPDAKLSREVPFAAVVAERTKRKEAQEALKAAQEELARLRGGQPPQQQQAEQPTPQTDPIAIIERLEREVGELRQGKRQEVEMGTFQRTVIAKEAEYLKENPDYPKMVEYLKESRVRELREGLGLSDAEIGQALAQEAAATAKYALDRDLNPAEVFSRMAIAKGWKAPAAEPKKPEENAAVVKLETIAKGQRVAKGLSSAGGGAPSVAPTLEAIASMDDAEFDTMWKNGTIKKMMG